MGKRCMQIKALYFQLDAGTTGRSAGPSPTTIADGLKNCSERLQAGSEPKRHKGNEDADVEGRLRKGRIGEHRPQSEAANNKPDCDQDDQSEEQVPHKGVNQDAS